MQVREHKSEIRKKGKRCRVRLVFLLGKYQMSSRDSTVHVCGIRGLGCGFYTFVAVCLTPLNTLSALTTMLPVSIIVMTAPCKF